MAFVDWYNHKHRLCGIRFATPAQRHTGQAVTIASQRADVYERALRQHPFRPGKESRWVVDLGKRFLELALCSVELQELVLGEPLLELNGVVTNDQSGIRVSLWWLVELLAESAAELSHYESIVRLWYYSKHTRWARSGKSTKHPFPVPRP